MPNPAKDNVVLETNIAAGKTGSYRITDITGRQLLGSVINNDQENINISQLTPGMHMLDVYEDGQGIKKMKLVKE